MQWLESSKQSRRHGGLWWAYPPNKLPSPSNWNMNHYKSVGFSYMWSPHAQKQSPLLKTFWRRFWLQVCQQHDCIPYVLPVSFTAFLSLFVSKRFCEETIGVARGEGDHSSTKFLECLVIVCFERRYLKHNTVASLKSNILPPSNFGLATSLEATYTMHTQYLVI